MGVRHCREGKAENTYISPPARSCAIKVKSTGEVKWPSFLGMVHVFSARPLSLLNESQVLFSCPCPVHRYEICTYGIRIAVGLYCCISCELESLESHNRVTKHTPEKASGTFALSNANVTSKSRMIRAVIDSSTHARLRGSLFRSH